LQCNRDLAPLYMPLFQKIYFGKLFHDLGTESIELTIQKSTTDKKEAQAFRPVVGYESAHDSTSSCRFLTQHYEQTRMGIM
jgi:hypothetical protein